MGEIGVLTGGGSDRGNVQWRHLFLLCGEDVDWLVNKPEKLPHEHAPHASSMHPLHYTRPSHHHTLHYTPPSHPPPPAPSITPSTTFQPPPHIPPYRPVLGVVLVTVSAALSAIVIILSHMLGDLLNPRTIYTRNDCVRAPTSPSEGPSPAPTAPAVVVVVGSVVARVVMGVWSSSPLEMTSLTPSAVVVEGPMSSSSLLLLLLPLSLCACVCDCMCVIVCACGYVYVCMCMCVQG